MLQWIGEKSFTSRMMSVTSCKASHTSWKEEVDNTQIKNKQNQIFIFQKFKFSRLGVVVVVVDKVVIADFYA